ncbi:MAG TPA: sigma-70 region 4 domain-containing protein, partial [Solirubrobacteraceae bacterium]|nr:sigma-70 region 4 domain-containing protein [Solirubrobacteraceae bacterium]
CRARAVEYVAVAENGDSPSDLAGAVDQEIRNAVARLPERQREVLALREVLRLSHEQIAKVMGIDGAAVAPLLARARLRLRELRRDAPAAPAACDQRDRALRALARRQDSEPLTGEDDEWLFAHLGSCPECDQAHAAMIEASVCYRAAASRVGPAAGVPSVSSVSSVSSGPSGPSGPSVSSGPSGPSVSSGPSVQSGPSGPSAPE